MSHKPKRNYKSIDELSKEVAEREAKGEHKPATPEQIAEMFEQMRRFEANAYRPKRKSGSGVLNDG